MIVCVCNAIREEQLRAEARKGATTPARAYAQLGCKAKCGSCLPFARRIIDEELDTLSEATAPACAA
jgi:bacterioferritin-associated ferredoxin